MYFPFLDLGTSSLLQSIMDEAYNYADFIDRLVDKVCSDDSTGILAYIAAILTWATKSGLPTCLSAYGAI
jgi:hypothetical protein